jgi:hypothetical protein
MIGCPEVIPLETGEQLPIKLVEFACPRHSLVLSCQKLAFAPTSMRGLGGKAKGY